jgi:copper chaperone CopZ
VGRVTKTLQALSGVREVVVSLEQRSAWVRYVETTVSPERLVAAINKLGFKAGTPTGARIPEVE